MTELVTSRHRYDSTIRMIGISSRELFQVLQTPHWILTAGWKYQGGCDLQEVDVWQTWGALRWTNFVELVMANSSWRNQANHQAERKQLRGLNWNDHFERWPTRNDVFLFGISLEYHFKYPTSGLLPIATSKPSPEHSPSAVPTNGQVVDEFLHRMTVTISNYAIYQADFGPWNYWKLSI